MKKKWIQLLTILGASTSIFITAIELSNIKLLNENKGILYFSLIIILLGIFLIWLLVGSRLIGKSSIFKVSVLGRPAVGKTVYVTVLFNELLRFSHRKYEFSALDKETTEIALERMRLLSDGIWPSATTVGVVFSHKVLLMKNSFSQKKNIIEITDFSGEDFRNAGDQYRESKIRLEEKIDNGHLLI